MLMFMLVAVEFQASNLDPSMRMQCSAMALEAAFGGAVSFSVSRRQGLPGEPFQGFPWMRRLALDGASASLRFDLCH